MTTWVKSAEAAAILSRVSEREITPAYARVLAHNGKIASKIDPANKSRLLFSAEACAGYKVARCTDRRVEIRVRDKRSGRPPGRPRKDGGTQ